jgi:hypothetical protein
MTIFRCLPSCEDDRPEINFSHPTNMQNDWDLIEMYLDGDSDTTVYPYVEIYVDDGRALEWDLYHCGGSMLCSTKFLDTIGVRSLYGLLPLPAYMNGEEYWFFRCEKTLDCLDREKSEFDVFSDDPKRVMFLYKAVFIEEMIGEDTVFTIPGEESTSLFMTEPVANRLIKAKIKGMKLTRDVDINDFKY